MFRSITSRLWGTRAVKAAYDPILREFGEAIVSARIAYRKPGRIYYKGSWWKAQCHLRDVVLEPGAVVRVVGRQIIVLCVEPCQD